MANKVFYGKVYLTNDVSADVDVIQRTLAALGYDVSYLPEPLLRAVSERVREIMYNGPACDPKIYEVYVDKAVDDYYFELDDVKNFRK